MGTYGPKVLLAAILVVGGCSESTTKSNPEPGGTRLRAALGETLTLSGPDGVAVAISVGAVADPATGSIQPRRENRHVAIRVRVENVGGLTYSDTPSNGAYLVDDQGHQHGADIADSVLPALGSPRIRPGGVETGFITFEVPEHVEPVRFLLTLDGGFGPETGDWALF